MRRHCSHCKRAAPPSTASVSLALIHQGCVFVSRLLECVRVPLVSNRLRVSRRSWSGHRNSHLPLFRGNCFGETLPGRLGRTVGAPAKQSLSQMFLSIREFCGQAGRPGHEGRNIGGAGATPRKRPSLAQPGLSERPLTGFVLAARRSGPGDPRRHPPTGVPIVPRRSCGYAECWAMLRQTGSSHSGPC